MSAPRVQPPRGTADVFESDLRKIEHVQGLGFDIARSYGFFRVDTPMFEHLDIFELTAPFSRDKCYVFPDKSGRELTLRPDIMAPISRSVVNNCLTGVFPAKLFFADKVFRYRHAKRREFRLFGLETYGSKGYDADAELILVAMDIFRKIGLTQLVVEFSYPDIYAMLIEEAVRIHSLSFEPSELLHQLQLCKSEEEIHLLLVKNGFPKEMQDLFLRMLLCKDESCGWKSIKEIADRTNKLAQVASNLMEFSEALDAHNLKNSSVFNIGNLHGLGYYSGLTYRINTVGDNQQLADGGRYDTFIQRLCGKSINATGIAFGIERLIRIAESRKISLTNGSSNNPRILIASSDRSIMKHLRPMLYVLRQRGYIVEEYSQMAKFPQTIKYAQARNYGLLLSFDRLRDQMGKITVRTVSLAKDRRQDYIIDDVEESIGSFLNEIL